MMPEIEARSLTKVYGRSRNGSGGVLAVDNIDFTIDRGETFGFLGPNGAGKTTIMKLIYCFVKLTSGSLTVCGLDVRQQQRRIKSMMGIVPQEDSLDPDLTVFGNLITYSRYYEVPGREARQRALKLLEMLSLTEKKDIVIDNLSGGMKRRLLIARGLINEPRILILDEPTVGLDPQARHLIWSKLKELRRLGITILVTTHYMEEAARLCDRLVMMNNGRILDSGSPSELVNRHIGKEVLEIDEVDDEMFTRIMSALGGRLAFDRHGRKLFLFTESAMDTVSSLKDLRLSSVIERKADLEDVFLKLTGRTLID